MNPADAVIVATADLELPGAVTFGVEDRRRRHRCRGRNGRTASVIGGEAAAEVSAVAGFTVDGDAMKFVFAAPRMQLDLSSAPGVTAVGFRDPERHVVATGRSPRAGKAGVVSTDKAEREFPVPLEDEVGFADTITGLIHLDVAAAFGGRGELNGGGLNIHQGEGPEEGQSEERFHV